MSISGGSCRRPLNSLRPSGNGSNKWEEAPGSSFEEASKERGPVQTALAANKSLENNNNFIKESNTPCPVQVK
jgi:hypothetical protein